jgi:hypothetical protein
LNLLVFAGRIKQLISQLRVVDVFGNEEVRGVVAEAEKLGNP